VGVVAIVGFVIGIAWPRLAGVQLVPEAPSEDADLTEAAPATGTAAATATAATVSDAPAPAVPTQRLKVEFAELGNCRDADGKKQKECGTLDLSSVVEDRLQALAACDVARSVEGTLSLMMVADFEKERLVSFQSGKSTTLSKRVTDGVLSCAQKEFETASLKGVEHQWARYDVYYYVHFLAPGTAASVPGGSPGSEGAAATEGITSVTGTATVVWSTALVRAQPAQDGRIVARLGGGTRVVVTAKKESWFRVKYDARGSEGWVFGKAIGQ